MVVELHRLWLTPNSTCGLLAIDGTSKFYSLERPKGSPMEIVAGTYHVIKQFSPHFQRIVPHLQDVPGHTFIEMHVANQAEDLRGCIGIGETHAVDWIGNSQAAFEQFMALVPDEFDLQITDSAPNDADIEAT